MRRIGLLLLAFCAPLLAQSNATLYEREKEANTRLAEQATSANNAADRAEQRSKEIQTRLAEAKASRTEFQRRYAGRTKPAHDVVQEEIDALRAEIDSLENDQSVIADRHAAAGTIQIELERASRGWEARLEKTKEEDKSVTSKSLWESSGIKMWKGLKAERAALYKRIRDGLSRELAALEARETSTAELIAALNRTLALHRHENLLLRSPPDLTWAGTRDALGDLQHIPGWFSDAGTETGAYLGDEEHRSGLLRWLGAAIAIAIVILLLGRTLKRRALRREAKEEEAAQERTLQVVDRLIRRGLLLALVFLIPWSAATLLHDLPPAFAAFLFSLARAAAWFYLIWAVYRELLRPDAPEHAPVKLSPQAQRLCARAVFIYLGSALAFRLPMIMLEAGGHANPVGILVLELLYLGGATIALSGILFRRRVFSALLPKGDSGWAKIARGLGLLIRPLLQLLLPALLVLNALRYEALATMVAEFSIALVAAIVAGALGYQVLRSLWLRWIAIRYADDADSDLANAVKNAGLFACRVTVFLAAAWLLPYIAGSTADELRETLQVPLPFLGDDSRATVWNLMAALALGLFFWFGTRHAKALLQFQILERTNLDTATKYTTTTLFGYVVLTAGLVAATRMVMDLSALGTIVAALSVGIGFGLQDVVSNFISGIILLFERPIRVGDTIEVGPNRGLVRQINIRATTVQTRDNIFLLVPNRDLISQPVVNYGYEDPKLRISVPVGVSYDSDPEQIRDILMKIAGEHKNVLRHPLPMVEFTEFGDSSLNFRLLVWIQRAEQKQRITSDLNFAIFAAFSEANVEIPFPQRDLHVRSADGLLNVPAPAEQIEPPPEEPPQEKSE
ncbi:MAG: mechanosensitive ion channel family protein [Planctomycetota bacterium]|jgi:small-conductance mechanosensitive channel